MSQAIDSQWRRLLEALAQSIEKELHPILSLLPSSAEDLSHVETRVKILEQWVGIAYDISNVLHRAKVLKNTAPPTVVKWVKRKCEEALAPIQSWYTTPDELEAMKAAAKEAKGLIESVREARPIPELEKKIKEREGRLKPRIEVLMDLWADTFYGLLDTFNSVAETSLVPHDYFERDTLSLRVDALNEYGKLLYSALLERAANGAALGSVFRAAAADGHAAAVAVASDDIGPEAPPRAFQRLLERRFRFYYYLRAQTYESIEMARLFLTEMRQDIYPDGVARELGLEGGPGITIQTDPAEVKTGEPVRLTLRFNRLLLNEAAAYNEWDCLWNFGDGGAMERGWEVYQTYCEPKTYSVSVTLRDIEGRPLPGWGAITREIDVAVPDTDRTRKKGIWGWMRNRLKPSLTMVELGRLFLIVIVAVFGLMATAQTQIEKLSFLGALAAAFGIGFAADVLKSMVTNKAGEGGGETTRH